MCRPHVSVCPGDTRRCTVPFLVPPESSGEPWQLFYATATGRAESFDIDGQLDEADAVAAAQDRLLTHGWLSVEVEVQLDE